MNIFNIYLLAVYNYQQRERKIEYKIKCVRERERGDTMTLREYVIERHSLHETSVKKVGERKAKEITSANSAIVKEFFSTDININEAYQAINHFH